MDRLRESLVIVWERLDFAGLAKWQWLLGAIGVLASVAVPMATDLYPDVVRGWLEGWRGIVIPSASLLALLLVSDCSSTRRPGARRSGWLFQARS